MNATYRRAVYDDIPKIMEVIRDAQAALKADGLPQWQDGFPNERVVHDDIEFRNAYNILVDDEIMGFVVVSLGDEPDYKNPIRGEFKYNEPYGVIHRCSFRKEAKGLGLSKFMFQLCYDEIKKAGYDFARIDTHQGNKRMRHIMEREGFAESAIIVLGLNGQERIVGEKQI